MAAQLSSAQLSSAQLISRRRPTLPSTIWVRSEALLHYDNFTASRMCVYSLSSASRSIDICFTRFTCTRSDDVNLYRCTSTGTCLETKFVQCSTTLNCSVHDVLELLVQNSSGALPVRTYRYCTGTILKCTLKCIQSQACYLTTLKSTLKCIQSHGSFHTLPP